MADALQPPVRQVRAVADDPCTAANRTAVGADRAPRRSRHGRGRVAAASHVRRTRRASLQLHGLSGSTPCPAAPRRARRGGAAVRRRARRQGVGVTGAGRSFCAGFDLDDFAHPDPGLPMREVATSGGSWPRRSPACGRYGRRRDGRCVGGGVALAARATSGSLLTTPSFSIPEVELGIRWLGWHPPSCGRSGRRSTKELVLTCRRSRRPRPPPPASSTASSPAPSWRHGRRACCRQLAPRSTLTSTATKGARQRRRRGDGLDGRRPARRRHPGVGTGRP